MVTISPAPTSRRKATEQSKDKTECQDINHQTDSVYSNNPVICCFPFSSKKRLSIKEGAKNLRTTTTSSQKRRQLTNNG